MNKSNFQKPSHSPLVSIFVGCYNHSTYVIETLESVIQQTYPNIQLIIWDDKSSDSSPEIIQNWIKSKGIECIFIKHTENVGICRSLNEALSVAQGKYIAMVAADDVWLPEKISRHVDILEKLPENIGVLYSDAYRMDQAGKILPGMFIESLNRNFSSPPVGDLFEVLWEENFIPAMTTMIRRECFIHCGNYDEDLSFEDWEMWLRISRNYHYAYDEIPSAVYRILPTSMINTMGEELAKSIEFFKIKYLHREWLNESQTHQFLSEYIETGRLCSLIREKTAHLTDAVADLSAENQSLEDTVANLSAENQSLDDTVANLSAENQSLEAVIESAKRWQKGSWVKRAFHRWRVPGADRKKINFLKRIERSVRKRRDQLLKRGSKIQDQKKHDTGPEKSGVTFIRSLAFHHSGKPRGWVRFLLFHKNKKPRHIFIRVSCKKSGRPRKLFSSWMNVASSSSIRNDRTCDEWIKQFDELTVFDRQAMESNIKKMKDPPVISVVMPTHNTKSVWLRKAIDSVRNQIYPHWQLCIADDGSTEPQVRDILEHYCKLDSRIRVAYRRECGNISAATNTALGLVKGDYVALLDHDDTLEPHALARCAETIIATAADVIYTDQDTTTDDGRVIWTFHKPDWSPEYLRHVMYVGHLLVVRSTLVKKLGGFHSEHDGVQDFEFMLRLSEATNKIVHISEVLYHWHAVDGSIAASTTAKSNIADKQVRAVQSYLDRNAISAIAIKHPYLPHRCRIKPLLKDYPKVSIIIPSKDQAEIIKVCLDSIYAKTTYPDFEVIIVDSGTTQPEALAVLASHPVRVFPLERQFNFSAACNLGARKASGAILVFLNNDTEVITEDWLDHLVFHLIAEDVGAVGPLLLYPNGKVQHAGVVLGARGTADHVARHFPADSDGYAGSLSCPREVSAVTGACLAINKSNFLEVGMFSELYGTHYQDVDLCLKLRQRSLRCIYTPEARLFHHESISRGHDSYDFLDRLLLIDSWSEVLLTPDPYYPGKLSLDRLDYSTN